MAQLTNLHQFAEQQVSHCKHILTIYILCWSEGTCILQGIGQVLRPAACQMTVEEEEFLLSRAQAEEERANTMRSMMYDIMDHTRGRPELYASPPFFKARAELLSMGSKLFSPADFPQFRSFCDSGPFPA